MKGPNVVVVGAGFAGCAAAYAAARSGARVMVLHDRVGSSALYSGAVDGPATAGDAASELDGEVRAFARELGLWDLERTLVATREGVVRRVSGADVALLDLAPLGGRRIGVADVERDEWDGRLLAEAFQASDWAVQTNTQFRAVPVADIYRGYERRLTAHDFARLHDDPARQSAFAETLMTASTELDAWLVGPWLGTQPETAAAVRRRMMLPVGETCSAVGGAAGARFENARDRLFGAHGCSMLKGRLLSVSARGERWALSVDTDEVDGPDLELEAAAVVLATGGVAAGGIGLEWEPGQAGQAFRLQFSAPASLSIDGGAPAVAGSLFGPPLDVRGLGTLERVGILGGDDGAVLAGSERVPGLFAAGDALSARPRTVLEALASGLRAGRSAAHD